MKRKMSIKLIIHKKKNVETNKKRYYNIEFFFYNKLVFIKLKQVFILILTFDCFNFKCFIQIKINSFGNANNKIITQLI